jgi:membrane protein involved in colicin uptake
MAVILSSLICFCNSQVPVDGRRAILEAERAKAEIEEREREAQRLADAEAQAAVEEARKASQLAAQLEAEARKLAAEEAKAATIAAKAQAKAEAASASVDGLEAKAKELGISTFSNPLGGRSLGSFIPKLEEVKSRLPKGEKGAIPELATATEIGQKPVKQFFGGLFKQDTIYVDED